MPIAALDWTSIVVGGVVGAVLGAVASLLATSALQSSVDRGVRRVRARLSRGQTDLPALSGIWFSEYVYTSGDDPDELVSQHYVVLTQSRSYVSARSLPKPEGSTVKLELELEGSMLSGQWREYTSKDALYRGTVQFQVDEIRKDVAGRWVGFSRSRGFQTGEWRLKLIAREANRKLRREYSDRHDLL